MQRGAQSQGRLHSSTEIAVEVVKGAVNLDLCGTKCLKLFRVCCDRKRISAVPRRREGKKDYGCLAGRRGSRHSLSVAEFFGRVPGLARFTETFGTLTTPHRPRVALHTSRSRQFNLSTRSLPAAKHGRQA